MPSRSATSRGNTEAWPWPVDCTLRLTRERAVAGEGEPGALERRAAGMFEHAGNADAAIFAALSSLRAGAP